MITNALERLRSVDGLLTLGGFVLLAAVLTGCGNGLSPEEISGNYSLDQVNGDTLPALVDQITIDGGSEPDTTVTLEVESGQFTLNSDRSYSLSLSAREVRTANGSESSSNDGDAQDGRYNVDGNDLELAPTRSDTIDLRDYPFQVRSSGQINGDRVILTVFRDSNPFADTLSLRFVQ